MIFQIEIEPSPTNKVKIKKHDFGIKGCKAGGFAKPNETRKKDFFWKVNNKNFRFEEKILNFSYLDIPFTLQHPREMQKIDWFLHQNVWKQ